jgi:antitoxin ParD1/3/4
MNVSLTPELEKYIQKQVASQRYQTASEVVRQAVRLMQQEEAYEKAKLEALRHDVQIGLDEPAQGRHIEGKDLSVARIRKLAIEKFGDPRKRKRSRK